MNNILNQEQLQSSLEGVLSFTMPYATYQNGFRKLIAWKEAHSLTLMIYKVTATFPVEERYGLTSQLCRAASSIGAQIAEGSRMQTIKHRKLFYTRAYASAAEVDNFLELVHSLNFINNKTYEELLEKINKVSFLIHKLIESLARPTLPTIHTSPSVIPISHNHAPATVHSPDE